MTTINNDQSLIEKVGGIEKAREIVDGAPEGASHIRRGIYFKYRNPVEWHYWEENQWKFTSSDITKSVFLIDLNNLRTAIAKHDNAQLCIGCGSPDLHKGGEIKEPKMCLDCFAEMVGFTRTSNGFVESDEVIDIRNHVSPSTRVVDL